MSKKMVGSTNSFTKTLVTASFIVLLISCCYQIVFFGTEDNLKAIGCITLVWIIFTTYFITNGVLKNYPLSGLTILGFTISQLYFPLVFTTLENKPVIFNLDLPNKVFFHSCLEFFVLIAAHSIYRYFSNHFRRFSSIRRPSSIMYRLGFFQPPNEAQVWTMGFIGIAASYYVFFVNPEIGREVTGTAVDKFMQSLVPFSYAPFFIPLGRLYRSSVIVKKRIWVMLLLYTLLIFALSIGRNNRGAFMFGFTSIAIAYLLALFIGIYRINLFTLRNACIALIGFWLLTGPLADLATAMVIVRNGRTDVKPSQLIGLTLDAFKDKKSIDLKRQQDNLKETDWDERYLNNIFTARFSNIKFNDASLVQASKVGEKNPLMLDYSLKRAVGALPDPVLKILNITVDKNEIYSISFGDYLYLLAGANYNTLHGYRVGHLSGTGMAAFGWWYLLILGVAVIPAFLLIDKLVFIRTKINNRTTTSLYRFSFCGLLALISFFQFLPSESVIVPIVFLIRGWLQIILLYFIIFHLTKFIIPNMQQLMRNNNLKLRQSPPPA